MTNNEYSLQKFINKIQEDLDCPIVRGWASKRWKSHKKEVIEDILVSISSYGRTSLGNCVRLAYHLFEERNFNLENFHLIRGNETNLEVLSKGLYALYYQGQYSKRELQKMGILS